MGFELLMLIINPSFVDNGRHLSRHVWGQKHVKTDQNCLFTLICMSFGLVVVINSIQRR